MLENYSSLKSTDELLKNESTLAVIAHADGIVSHHEGVLNSGLVGFEKNTNEVWQVAKPVERGTSGNCQWSKTDDLMFISIVGDHHIASISDVVAPKLLPELLTNVKQNTTETSTCGSICAVQQVHT